MNNHCWAKIVLVLLCVAGTKAADAATKVFILAGQSNMLGSGAYVSELSTPYDEVQPDVNYWSDNQWIPLRGGFGHTSDEFGPEVSFGEAIHRAIPSDEVFLIKYAVGSTNLAEDWSPAGAGKQIYQGFITTAEAAIKNLVDAGRQPEVAGMLWMQGESDALADGFYAPTNAAAVYAENLRGFIESVRDDLGTPDLPFVIGRITVPHWGTPENNALVRSAQETVPGLVGHASWIDTDNMAMGPFVGHYGAQGQIDLGIAFAGAVQQLPEPGTIAMLLVGIAAFACGTTARTRLRSRREFR